MTNYLTGNPISDIRFYTGWKQSELAKKLGITQGAVSLIETGKRRLSGPLLLLADKVLVEVMGSYRNMKGADK